MSDMIPCIFCGHLEGTHTMRDNYSKANDYRIDKDFTLSECPGYAESEYEYYNPYKHEY